MADWPQVAGRLLLMHRAPAAAAFGSFGSHFAFPAWIRRSDRRSHRAAHGLREMLQCHRAFELEVRGKVTPVADGPVLMVANHHLLARHSGVARGSGYCRFISKADVKSVAADWLHWPTGAGYPVHRARVSAAMRMRDGSSHGRADCRPAMCSRCFPRAPPATAVDILPFPCQSDSGRRFWPGAPCAGRGPAIRRLAAPEKISARASLYINDDTLVGSVLANPGRARPCKVPT